MTRIFFSAGEASGDIHGANLIRALRAMDNQVRCDGLGGRRMAEAGMDLRCDLAGQAIMGFTEVVRSLRMIRRLFYDTVNHLRASRPDCVVLIDYPGFNMRLGKKAKALGIPVVYYIGPQVWAWKKGRVFALAKFVRKMLVILPFEQDLYARAGVECRYVGHPLFDHWHSTAITGRFRGGTVIGLLPGSREQEIRRLMGVMVAVARGIRQRYPEARFITPCVDTVREAQVRALAGDFPLETVVGGMYEVLDAARFCLVASGTATLETALFEVPMAVLYRVSGVSHWIARRVVSISHIAMVNILAGRGIVPEFIQQDACVDQVLPAALDLIAETSARTTMRRELAKLREGLGGEGASQRAAQEIMEIATKTSHG